jgi:serine/threonine protein phosphatase 1
MRLRHQIGSFLFVHAGIRPGVPLEDQSVDDLTLIRDDFLLAQRNDGLIVVHGHTPVAEVDIRSNRINLDTGAYLTGKLSCIAIEQDRFRLV